MITGTKSNDHITLSLHSISLTGFPTVKTFEPLQRREHFPAQNIQVLSTGCNVTTNLTGVSVRFLTGGH